MNGRVGYREQYPEPPPVFGYPVDGGLMSHDRYLKYLQYMRDKSVVQL